MNYHDVISEGLLRAENSFPGLDTHREILLFKRLKMVEGHLSNTAQNFGARFVPLFKTYSDQNWPRPQAELFEDSLNFLAWVDQLPDKKLSYQIDQFERQWLRFLTNTQVFKLVWCGHRKNRFSLGLLYRTKAGASNLRIHFL